MLLVFLDIETTGLDSEKHRAVEIAFRTIDAPSGRHLSTYEAIVRQTPDVWDEADPESLKINGFTWEMLLSGKSEKVISSEIAVELNHAGLQEKGGVFICQNPAFDRAFFCQLINIELQAKYGWPYHWLDLASMYWALRQTQAKPPVTREAELSKNQIAAYFGLPPEPSPHRAIGGVNHLLSCYEALFGKFAAHH